MIVSELKRLSDQLAFADEAMALIGHIRKRLRIELKPDGTEERLVLHTKDIHEARRLFNAIWSMAPDSKLVRFTEFATENELLAEINGAGNI